MDSSNFNSQNFILKEYIGNSFNECRYLIDTNKNSYTKLEKKKFSYNAIKDFFKVYFLFYLK
jgi:hypothetical protein